MLNKARPLAYLGIDPGKTGALAILTADTSFKEATFYPKDPNLAAKMVLDYADQFYIGMVALEKVSSRPHQGVKSSFTFGTNFGIWQGIIATLGLPMIMPTPQKWQKGIIVPSDGATTKERSLAVARRMFPDVEFRYAKDHNRAEALLLAWYAKQQHSG